MRLVRASIENFKGVGVGKPLVIDFTSPSYADGRPLTCLLGDNGSGKTTVLQAIALTLSLATRQIERAIDFRWPGFELERIGSMGTTKIELKIAFSQDEIVANHEVLRTWYDTQPPAWRDEHIFAGPGEREEIDLLYFGGSLTCRQGFDAMRQMLGRYYYVNLMKSYHPLVTRYFSRIGDVVWFDQYRNLGSLMTRSGDGDNHSGASTNWEAGVQPLRDYLVRMWAYHTSQKRVPGRDYLESLEDRLNEIFPGIKFRGIEPRENNADSKSQGFYFWLERNGKYYDLAEMSSGEQAVFALVLDFVRHDIARSIVLIDEIELHLHPPEQQALLGMLRKIGPDCQFLITTHSRVVESIIPDDHEVRLEGGRLCL